MTRRARPFLAGLSASLAAITAALWAQGLPAQAAGEGQAQPAVEFTVVGPPIDASETGQDFIYVEPPTPLDPSSDNADTGLIAQGWSMLGREDRGAAAGSNEYTARPCTPTENSAQGPALGTDAVLDAIVARAQQTRIVIVNESHEVTLHRAFSARLIGRLRPHGYTVFAAETFFNRAQGPDPVEVSADLLYPLANDGHYLKEPVFGDLVRTARRLGYRLAAYEMEYDPDRERPTAADESIAQREEAQARNLAALFESLPPDQKLIVHVGYSHAREVQQTRIDGFDLSWMASRLKRKTGVDPLTINQTDCRGSGDAVQLVSGPRRTADWFDLFVDHPAAAFRHGRAVWRFDDGRQSVAIPEPYASAGETLIIEAFHEDEPFEAVPADRVWVEPGEDVRLALAPGRYRVRAVRPLR